MTSTPETLLAKHVDLLTIDPLTPWSKTSVSPLPVEQYSMPSDGRDGVSGIACSDVLRRIAKPRFPIRVSSEGPPPFPLEGQLSVMRWAHERCHFLPDPVWLKEPCIEHIKDTVWPYLEQLGADSSSISVEFLAEGGFNRVYTIHSINKHTNSSADYVFRVALPVDPYFKTESEVATTEIIRHFTNIPVPIIYAYDSSTMNVGGLEWILMEKVIGNKLEDTWESFDYDTKVKLTKTITSWTTSLSKITSNKIGNIYMTFTETDLEFYVGRSVSNLFSQENRLTYDICRGPFKTLQDFYDAVLGVADQDVAHVTSVYSSGAFKFEPTPRRPTFQGTFLDPSIWYYLQDYEDRTDEDWKAEQRKELEMLSTGLKELRVALPAICAKAPESSKPLTTYLAHDDLSRRNIFVDDTGTPVALLDWEALPLMPPLFLTNPPMFIQTCDYEYDEPIHDPVENEESYERFGYSEEEKQGQRKSSEEWYAEKIEEYTCTKLRSVYREELERVGSPLAKAVWDDYDELDCQLLERVCDTSQNVHGLAEWTEAMLATEESDDDEHETENDEDEGEELEDAENENGGHGKTQDELDADLERRGYSRRTINILRQYKERELE